MRQLIIVVVLLAGLLGLGMSLCGGGFFVMMAYTSIRNIIQSGQQDQVAGLVLLIIPGAFFLCGAGLFWVCFQFIRRSSSGDERKKR